MWRSLLPTTLSCLALAACSDDASPGADGDTRADTGPDTSADTGPDTSPDTDTGADTTPDVDPQVPILERPSADAYRCTETLAPAQIPAASWFAVALMAVGEDLWLLRAEGGMQLSRMAKDGTLGASIALGAPEWGSPGAVMAEDGGRLTLVWRDPQDTGGEQLKSAVVSSAGEVLVAPVALAGTLAAEAATPRITPRGAGYRLVWIGGGDSGARTLFAAQLEGGALSSRIELAAAGAAYGGAVLGVVNDADGFVVAWSASNESLASEVWLQAFAADGTPRHPAKRISVEAKDGVTSGPGWYAPGGAALEVVGDRYLVVFTEDHQPPSGNWTDLGHAFLQVAVVDARGEGSLTPLAAPVDGRIATAASFYRLGDAVGLYWAEGTVIRICAGCYVDYVLRTVLLDGAALTPLSAPATHTAQPHGFNNPRVAVIGDEVISVSMQDFHALSWPATAVMRCVPPD